MSELFDKSIRTLELPRVLKLLADQAVSPEAKELALAVRPETDYEDVLRLLDQTDGARTMSALHGAPGFSGVKPVRELLDRADRGGMRGELPPDAGEQRHHRQCGRRGPGGKPGALGDEGHHRGDPQRRHRGHQRLLPPL